ncbi:MAG: AAA family ATPase [Fusobacteriota bacterium]
MDKIKRIPYGKGDFEAVNKENRYYIDKTMYIPLIEETDFIFLIRPRRFGKTLFLSMLQSYYDIKKRDKFKELFRDTWILENSTDERSKYMVLYFNFSMVLKKEGEIQENFNKYCMKEIDKFVDRYKEYLPERLKRIIKEDKTAHTKLQTLSNELKDEDIKIYLMIDEYDNFTNSIISDYGSNEYNKVTKSTGYFRDFFTVLKGMTSGSGAGLARMFITGVSPVTMDDVTSGFNIGDNISVMEKYNEILGFTKKDVEEMIDYYTSVGVFNLDRENSLKIMKKWYNSYKFSEHAEKDLFNTDAVLYFMKMAYNSKHMTNYLIDDNLRMDYGKLRHLINIDQKLNGNFNKLKEIIENNGISSSIKLSFPHDRLTDKENFISLLYYFGLLTFTGEYNMGEPYLKIPNETIKNIMFEYIRGSFEDVDVFSVDMFELKKRFQKLAYRGEFKGVFNFIADEIKKQTKIRDYIQGEKMIQGFFLAYMNVLDFYISLSEEERNKGYADIVLKPFYLKYPDIKYAYLFEFKYISRMNDEEKLQEKIDEKIQESREQLKQYDGDDNAKKMMHTEPYGKVKVKKAIIIFHGWELVYIQEV